MEAIGVAEKPTFNLRPSIQEINGSEDVDWLCKELTAALGSVLDEVVRMAAIVKRLDELGVEITVARAQLPFLRRIAHGNMVPELYVALEGSPQLLQKAASLPRPLQLQVARNEPLMVMEAGGDYRMVPPLSMTASEVNQVFANGRLRSDAEQVGIARERLARFEAKRAMKPDGVVGIDRKRRGIVIADVFIPLADLAKYVAELSSGRNSGG